MGRKGKVKYLSSFCLLLMVLGTLYGCGTNSSTVKLADTEIGSKEEITLKETELPTETETTDDFSSIAENEQTLSTEPESQNEIPSPTSQEKSLCGTYELSFEDGGAELEIIYSQEKDIYSAVFSGSLGMDAGSTEGFLSAYTDGTDNIWEYYDNSEFDSGNYNPSFRLQYDGLDSVTVTSLDGQTFGGMRFPGFAGEYVRTAEYPMP